MPGTAETLDARTDVPNHPRQRPAYGLLPYVAGDELLHRRPAIADWTLMARAIESRSVMVTGAAGSIGSEVVRQVLPLGPKRIVLLSASEGGLYQIDCMARSLASMSGSTVPEIVSVLGSVTNANLVNRVMRTNEVEVVYHAAAYKHVPILEQNAVVGVRNNVVGTEVLIDAAERNGVETFVYVSTDKAISPANVLGASKRIGEMLVQANSSNGSSVRYAIVRFGNVLDSSGSIVRLFREQIRAGGPVTVTDPQASRYFISISEAASLILQAGGMAESGEIFMLDMGQPTRILDLAKEMVARHGLQVRSPATPHGDIDIVITGLRPGDKLTEALPSDCARTPTSHPHIFQVADPAASFERVYRALAVVKQAITDDDQSALRRAMHKMIKMSASDAPCCDACQTVGNDSARTSSAALHYS